MNKDILNTEIQLFIKENNNTDISSLLFKKQLFEDVSNKELAEQLEARKRCEIKLPLWYATPGIYYPTKLNIEQTSSAITAAYKAKLLTGNRLIDITGGFGIDAYYFSLNFDEVIHCELQDWLSEIVQHNAKILERNNLQFKVGDGVEILTKEVNQFDVVYTDPSRRNDAKGKVFMLADCLPNIPDNLALIFSKTNTILIKTSPILDITNGLQELQNVAEIHIVAVKNEVKELLWILRKEYTGKVKLHTVNLQPENAQHFEFIYEEESDVSVRYALPKKYIYEPNAAILKSGGFRSVAATFGLDKLHQHSHLYTADTLVDFPGRIFQVEELLPNQKKVLKKQLSGTKANITSRNFPDKPDVFRKKYNIKDGSDVYVFLTTNIEEEKIVIKTKKIAAHDA